MKNIKYLNIIGLFVMALFFACEPFEDVNPEAGLVLPPDASEMNFTITPGDDAYHYNVQLTSPTLSGINQVSFDLGNGTVVKKESAVAYYPLPGDYTINLTIKSNGGSTSITQTHTTTETDYSIFTDEKFVALTGGIDDADGKTWVLDAESQGHLGVGSAGSDGLEWWSAAPFAKAPTGAYDDEITFNLNGFAVTYDNKGISYMKGYVKDDPQYAGIYLNPVENDTDFDVEYATPVSGTWAINEKDGGTFLNFSGDKPIFPCFEIGTREFEIVSISENYLELTGIDPYEGSKWHYILRNKEYEKPKVTFDVNVASGAEVNEYDVTVGNAVIPAGQSIDKVVVDFGDGTVTESDNYMDVLSNVYMRAGNYAVKVTITTSVETTETMLNAVVTENHPDYEEFLLDEIVMYNDFSEVILAPVNGQDCDVFVADNPDKTYPNKSSKVGYYSKTNNAWANANMELPAGYRFDLRQKSSFKMKVYGKAGQVVLYKLENTDKGEAWKTGAELTYTIQKDDTWEIVEFDFSGVGAGWDWTGEQFTSDIVTDDRFNNGFYNIIRVMLNPDIENDKTHEFYFDELAGPHVEGIKSATIK